MSKNFFKVLRPGINTTYQDIGRENLYHIGIPLVELWIKEIIFYLMS